MRYLLAAIYLVAALALFLVWLALDHWLILPPLAALVFLGMEKLLTPKGIRTSSGRRVIAPADLHRSPPSPPSKNKVVEPEVWRKSARGNDTTEIDGFRVTIFKQDGEWNYCISEILDEIGMEDGLEDDPQFGDGYPTKAAAQRAALAEL